MGSLHHRDIKNSESSIITYRAQQRDDDEQQSVKYLPDDIWRQILIQLPLKPLCISRCVCKAWRDFTRRRQYLLENRPGCVPLCGLFLISHNPQGEEETSDERVSYFCLRARVNFVLSHENSPIFPSRVTGGLMRDICFDFSMLQDFCETQAPLRFFGMHGGLLHLTYSDGTEQVHNPVTKQIYNVLKSPIVEKYGFNKHTVEEMRGLIIQVRPPHRSRRCGFVVVRFCVGESTIEFYRTRTCYWEAYPFKLDDEFLRSSHRLLYRNHAFFVDNGVVSLYVLTSSNFGIAIKFKGMMNPETRHFNFPLPEAALEGVNGRRIWASDGLYLTYYNETGLWIWKAGYTTDVDKWAWVPILEINPTKQVAKPGALKHLPKRVLNGGISVKPVAFVPTVPMLYLMIKSSSMYVYHIDTDTVMMVRKIKDLGNKTVEFGHPFIPCISIIEPSFRYFRQH